MAKHVCIIGAGPSGLVAAKTLVHNAPAGTFKVTMFDAQPRIGGLWPSSTQDDEGLVHPLMVTNQSKNTMHFSDLAWAADDPQFPRAWMVGRYLERYAERYLVRRDPRACQCPGAAADADVQLRLGWRVVGAELLEDARWRVTVRKSADLGHDEEEEEEEEEGARTRVSDFDHVLVASGFFGRPAVPSWVRGVADAAAVPVVHSSKYRHLEGLLGGRGEPGGGRILVVGGQMSGVETAATIASHLSSAVHSPGPSRVPNAEHYTVHHLIQRPAWVFPLYTTPKPKLAAPPFLPVDMPSYNLNNRPHPLRDNQGHIPPDTAMTMHNMYEAALGRNPSQFSPSIMAVPAEDRTEPPYLAMSEHYNELVRLGLITVSRGKLEGLDGTTALIANPVPPTSPPPASGEKLEDVAAVVLATGFDASGCVSFLPARVLEKLHHDPEERDLPLALGFHGTQNRAVPTLGFVGFYRSPYWGVMEMQARFLAALWTPDLKVPGVDAAAADDACVHRTLSLRGDPRRSQFPMGDYPFLMQEIAAALDLERSPAPRHDSDSDSDSSSPTLLLPHNNLPMDILTPSRYLSAFADEEARAENAEALRQADETAVAGLTSSRFVAHAVFRSLLGSWRLERSLESRLPSHPSGRFSGTARFLLREATGDGGNGGNGNPGEEYLYIEEGEFRADNGLTFQARRRYVWRYDEARDVMSVWFVRTDDDRRADYLFHQVEFLGPGQGPESPDRKGWKAKAGHLCIDDFYNVAYEFCFKAVELEQWTIGYTVKGPKKDYTIHGVYRRLV
ncbi:FAD/NAD(P)-binding domain-containing protein [Sodiomyces alkalinus F11]|uniref:FAD/NAD(P)-binding domain-containing protein n=1 Tax=Sodiomyces alkalinus (strain CBS 110278 / VKM F-3762 / F11) TaxID=1314773 RepID=A0A3N2PRL7_SODAK|nr:FAD/NAD(P)-binding domain-containing protein [Sodiomyces alkalinus F11]ROT37162.1 FAD/NAD(P)-binding domain-containing protein [Sodiomyces alkalinus F11]